MNDRSKAHSNSKNNLNEESVYKYSFKNNPISSYNELLFEIGENGRSGVDLPDFEVKENNLLDLTRIELVTILVRLKILFSKIYIEGLPFFLLSKLENISQHIEHM